jgi:RNA polymerase primary sigma factor
VSRFIHAALEQLADQQVRYTPPARRLEQLRRAEQLLVEIDPAKQYPYQFVCYRITDFRPEAYADLIIPGDQLRHDLGLLIDRLARSMPPRPVEEVEEPVLTLEELSRKLNVTTKTINRWRKRGLIGLPVLYKGRRQVGFLASLTNPFLTANQEQVARSSRFSQLTEEEKENILRRARRLARVPGSTLTEVSRRIARRLGRSAETIRCLIKRFDQEHPEQAIFPPKTPPLDETVKQRIYSDFYEGHIDVKTLARRFQRTRTSIYRILHERRAEELLRHPVEYIYHPSFDDPSAEAEILAPMPGEEEYEARRRQMRAPKDVPQELAPCYEFPLLNKEQEQHLFRKMNYLKYRARKMLDSLTRDGKLDVSRVRAQDLDKIEQLLRQATAIKDLLINANLRLVVSIAKRHTTHGDNFFELVSDGNMSLIRAVEKFDFSRGNKFSTYASWAIMKNFARSIPEEQHHRERYLTGREELFEITPDTRSDEHECLLQAEQASQKVNRLLSYLEPRERQIISLRAGLGDGQQLTLEKIGEQLGITKERVRQINVRAMRKLRELARSQKDETP